MADTSTKWVPPEMQLDGTTGVPQEWPGDTNIPSVAEVGSGMQAGMVESAALMGPSASSSIQIQP